MVPTVSVVLKVFVVPTVSVVFMVSIVLMVSMVPYGAYGMCGGLWCLWTQ